MTPIQQFELGLLIVISIVPALFLLYSIKRIIVNSLFNKTEINPDCYQIPPIFHTSFRSYDQSIKDQAYNDFLSGKSDRIAL